MREGIPTYYSMTLEDCANHLLRKKLDYKNNYYNIKIIGKITAEPIRQMIKLPYEITIYNSKGENRLMTGTKDAVSGESMKEIDITCKMNKSIFNIHTHIPTKDAKFDAASFADLLRIPDLRSKKKRAIAYTEGILIYGKCRRDIDNNILTYKKSIDDEYLEDMITEFLGRKKITLFDNIPGHKKVENLSQTLQSQYQKEFTTLTGLITEEALWDDKKNVNRIIKKIFGEYA